MAEPDTLGRSLADGYNNYLNRRAALPKTMRSSVSPNREARLSAEGAGTTKPLPQSAPPEEPKQPGEVAPEIANAEARGDDTTAKAREPGHLKVEMKKKIKAARPEVDDDPAFFNQLLALEQANAAAGKNGPLSFDDWAGARDDFAKNRAEGEPEAEGEETEGEEKGEPASQPATAAEGKPGEAAPSEAPSTAAGPSQPAGAEAPTPAGEEGAMPPAGPTPPLNEMPGTAAPEEGREAGSQAPGQRARPKRPKKSQEKTKQEQARKSDEKSPQAEGAKPPAALATPEAMPEAISPEARPPGAPTSEAPSAGAIPTPMAPLPMPAAPGRLGGARRAGGASGGRAPEAGEEGEEEGGEEEENEEGGPEEGEEEEGEEGEEGPEGGKKPEEPPAAAGQPGQAGQPKPGAPAAGIAPEAGSPGTPPAEPSGALGTAKEPPKLTSLPGGGGAAPGGAPPSAGPNAGGDFNNQTALERARQQWGAAGVHGGGGGAPPSGPVGGMPGQLPYQPSQTPNVQNAPGQEPPKTKDGQEQQTASKELSRRAQRRKELNQLEEDLNKSAGKPRESKTGILLISLKWIARGPIARVKNLLDSAENAKGATRIVVLETQLTAFMAAKAAMEVVKFAASVADSAVQIGRWATYFAATIIGSIIVVILSPILLIMLFIYHFFSGLGLFTARAQNVIKEINKDIKPIKDELAAEKKKLQIKRRIGQLRNYLDLGGSDPGAQKPAEGDKKGATGAAAGGGANEATPAKTEKPMAKAA
ncbi:MAG: hypothetical protein Q7K39_02345 [Candidatus Magasanikbacteria bacterium]|nr:hypothetical protein [Candidatus Magasanikbacteria bacterium]